MQNGLKKLNWKKLSKIVKIRAQIQKLSFFNGSYTVKFKAIKIITADIKKMNIQQIKKMKRHEKDIKCFITDLRKVHEEVRAKKIKSKLEEK